MSLLISHHLLHPRPLPPTYIPRERITSLFTEHSFAKIILVEAPAGYGKSVAVTEYVQRISSPCAWYPLDKLEEIGATAFIWNLVRSIQVCLPDFGQEITKRLELSILGKQQVYDETELYLTLLPSLISALVSLDGSLWIVLENYHTIVNTDVDKVLEYLVERSPEQVRFIVTTRFAPRWSKRPQWESRGDLATIPADMLSFTEVESYTLATRLNVQLDSSQVEYVYVTVKGWPILHHLLYQSCRGKNAHQVRTIFSVLNRPEHQVYQYLTTELLEREADLVQTFLYQTSLVSELDAALCNDLLNTADSEQILSHLASGPFLVRIGTDARTGQLTYTHSHEIVRSVLQQILTKEFGTAEVQRLHNRLGHIFEVREDWDRSITYYSQGQAFQESTRLIAAHADYLVRTSQLIRLSSWLQKIPDTLLQEEPHLLVYQGILLGNQKHPTAEEMLLRAERIFDERGDVPSKAWAVAELGWAYFLAGKFSQAETVLRGTLDIPDISPELRAKILHHLSMACNGLDYYSQSLEYLERSLHLFRQSTTSGNVSLTRLLRHLSHIYHSLGRTQDAVRALQEARDLVRSLNAGDWPLAWTNNQMAELNRHLGNYQAAHAYLDEADALLAQYEQAGSSSELARFITITRGHLYRDVYDFETAERLYYQAGRGHPNGVMLALRLAQQDHSYEALELAMQRWRDVQQRESVVGRSVYQAMLGTAYLGIGDYENAAAALEHAERVLEEHSALYYLVTVRMYLAKLYLVVGQRYKAVQRLHYALTFMAKEGYYALDWWQPWVVAELCAVALQEGIEVEYVERLAVKRLASSFATPFFPLINDPNLKVQEVAARILRSLGSTTDVEVRQVLNTCPEADTKRTIEKWLNSGWLTAMGLMRLKQELSWRQIEVFLLWICPRLQGSREQVAQELFLSKYTVNDHLDKVHEVFAPFPKGARGASGAQIAAYDWAIRNEIVDPYASSSC